MSDAITRKLESPYKKTRIENVSDARAIIVLGGGIRTGSNADGFAELNDAGDRILGAYRLFHEKKASRIILSGGRNFGDKSGISEAELMRDYLVYLGIPASALYLESSSRDTMENARFTKNLLESNVFPILENSSTPSKFILVTSAFHMARAVFSFESHGVPVEPYAVDYRAQRPTGTLTGWLPSTGSLSTTAVMIREFFGLLWYRLSR